jgi:CDP-paratose 2-epimerase
MKILVTGVCGFVGSTLARELLNHEENLQIVGLDKLSRPGSELNRATLQKCGVAVKHGDIRNPSDMEALTAVDWVIDAAANPSVLAGVSNVTSSRQLVEHNLVGTVNVLEYCRDTRPGLLCLARAGYTHSLPWSSYPSTSEPTRSYRASTGFRNRVLPRVESPKSFRLHRRCHSMEAPNSRRKS